MNSGRPAEHNYHGHPPTSFDKEVYIDAADRLEGSIKEQISAIHGIDDKAANTARLIIILLGIVFSVVAIIVNFDEGGLGSTSRLTEVAFFVGISFLLVSIGAAIITYLSSRFRVGLHYNVGYYLEDPIEEPRFETHIKRTLGAYGTMLEENKRVIEVNSKRFRRSLYTMLIGIVFLALSGFLYLDEFDPWLERLLIVAGMTIAGIAGWYILGGRYLTLQEEL